MGAGARRGQPGSYGGDALVSMRSQFRARMGRGAPLLAALVLAGLIGACTAASPVEVPAGQPGARGPCGVELTSLVNQVDRRHPLVVAEPTGEGRSPLGGRCDDASRPVVLVAHGYLGNFVEGYEGLVRHLVSQGHIVVFPGYTAEFDPDHQYSVVLGGFVQSTGESTRMDLGRLGVIGHSFGGGMLPWLVQQLDSRGWGAEAFWAVDFAPWFALEVGTGPIEVPDHLRFVMVSYQNDYFVDARIGIETFAALDLPASRKQHVMVYSDRSHSPALEADHLGPVSVELLDGLGTISTDNLDRWVTYRVADATAGCAITGSFCDADLSDTGTWPDGTPVRRAVVRDDQPDVGPPALQECQFVLNPRPCP